MMEIVPTVVPNSLEDVEVFLEGCRSFATVLHVDAADGMFAPNKTWIPSAGEKLPEADTIFYEAHLMVTNPEAVGAAFIEAGAKRLIAHIGAFDAEEDLKRTFEAWKQAGAKEVCAALLMETPLEALDPFIYSCDGVTLMSIATVGRQGIPFDERAYGRAADLHARYPELSIEIDGGVGETQIATLARAGATRFSVGSALAQSADPAATHKKLLELAQKAVS